MKIMADTNLYVSLFVSKSNIALKNIITASYNHDLIIPKYVIFELFDVSHKYPKLQKMLEKNNFDLEKMTYLMYQFFGKDISYINYGDSGILVPDPKDQPILDAAIKENIEIMISNDNHFIDLVQNINISKFINFDILKSGDFFKNYVDNPDNLIQIEEIECEYVRTRKAYERIIVDRSYGLPEDDEEEDKTNPVSSPGK